MGRAVFAATISLMLCAPNAGANGTSDDMPSVDAAAEIPDPSINPRTGVRWYRNVAYAGDKTTNTERQVLDLYLPADNEWMEGRPLLIWIHGGGWVIGSKDDGLGLYGRFCRKLAEHGIAAANVGYRLSPEVEHPGHIEDIAIATAWLVEHAEELGYDGAHLFVSGHSAGGHLAALLAVDEHYLKEAGVEPDALLGALPSSGVYDLTPMFEGRFAFGGAFPSGTAADASPVNHLDADDPPFLLLVESYGLQMRAQTDKMAEGLDEAGVEHELVEIPTSNHITMLSDLGKDDGISLTKSIVFIERILKSAEDEEDSATAEASPDDQLP